MHERAQQVTCHDHKRQSSRLSPVTKYPESLVQYDVALLSMTHHVATDIQNPAITRQHNDQNHPPIHR